MSSVNAGLWLRKTTVACVLLTAAFAKAQTDPIFDISSVKWNKSGSHSTHISSTDAFYRATNVNLKMLLQNAYNIRPELISGLPSWTDDAHFDIEAKVLDPTTVEHLAPGQRAAMMRQLLEDRFHLKAHIEQKTLPVFDLVVAKSGSKLTPSPPDLPKSRGTGINSHNNELDAHDIAMSAFADALTHQVDCTVIDKTNLTGKFDLTLKFAHEDNSAAPHGDSSDDLPSIFTAVQEQLGLKLEPRRMPVEVLVIDHVERPTEN